MDELISYFKIWVAARNIWFLLRSKNHQTVVIATSHFRASHLCQSEAARVKLASTGPPAVASECQRPVEQVHGLHMFPSMNPFLLYSSKSLAGLALDPP